MQACPKVKCNLCSHENRVEKILNMRKDGKTGWIICASCKSYINIRNLCVLEDQLEQAQGGATAPACGTY